LLQAFQNRMSKRRLSVFVDAELIEAAKSAVAHGRSENVSAWVNDALRHKLRHESQLKSLAAFIGAYEADYGEIKPDEMNRAVRRARQSRSE